MRPVSISPPANAALSQMRRRNSTLVAGPTMCVSRRAAAIRERALGPEHPDTAQTLSNLAAYVTQIARKGVED